MTRRNPLLVPPTRRAPRPTLEVLEDRTAPAVVGYYDMGNGQGVAAQVAPITTAGHTPVQLLDLTAADLAGIDVLFAQNPSNGGYGAEYLSRLADVNAAVAGGMTLILHDRFVSNAESILPGGSAFDIVRDFTDLHSINVLDASTVLTDGPGGVIDDTTLDNPPTASASSHGFAVAGSLPAQARLLLSTGDPTHVVTFSYRHGEGSVVYSTIPLDFYLNSPTNRPNFNLIYAPNVVAYGAGLLNAPPVAQDAAFVTQEDTPVSGTLPASDPNGDALTFSLVSGPAHGGVSVSSDGAFTYTPAPGFSGTDSFVFRASDGFLDDTAVVTVNVTPVNDPPVVDAGDDQVGDEGATFSFMGSATDADGDADDLVYTWDFGDGSGPASGKDASHAYAEDGVYTVTLTVDDGNGGVASDTLTVTVRNAAPAVSLDGPHSAVRGEPLSFAGSATDPGVTDVLTAGWVVTDANGLVIAQGSGLTFSFTPQDTGTYTVTLTVTDDDGAAGTASHALTVRVVELRADPNDPTRTTLLVGGTTGNDILVFFQDAEGRVAVILNGEYLGTFTPAVRLVAYGQAGNDGILVAGPGTLSAWLFGGSGNDLLIGGNGVDMIYGEEGDDILFGSTDDLLDGGPGSDWVFDFLP